MKALVLSEGSGTRLRPLTRTVREQLALVVSQPAPPPYPYEDIGHCHTSGVGLVVGEGAWAASRFGLRVGHLRQRRRPPRVVVVARDFFGGPTSCGTPAGCVRTPWLCSPRSIPLRPALPNRGTKPQVVDPEDKPQRPKGDLAPVGEAQIAS